jgi:hypothetical protein
VQDNFNTFKTEVGDIFNKKDKMIENLINLNKNLEEINSELKSKLLAYEEENNKGKFCMYCHKTFIPKFNEEVKNNQLFNHHII